MIFDLILVHVIKYFHGSLYDVVNDKVYSYAYNDPSRHEPSHSTYMRTRRVRIK
jgi:hypothetical protein